MGEWKRVKLGEICSLITKGATPRGEYQVANSKDAVAFVRAENVNGTTICRSELKCIDSSIHQRELKRSQLRDGDILITIAGAIGRTAIVDSSILPANINQAVAIIRLDTADFDRRFVLDYLRLPALREELTAISSGQSVQANLNLHQVGEIEIPCPPLPTQRRIAAVLGALDDKIEVNRKICENLEAQAQALFKAWFVDFEPFGGKRPEGWKMGKLGDVGEIVGGATPSKAKSEYYTDDGIAWITPKDISLQGTKFIAKGEIDITEKGFKSASVKLMSRGSVLFSSRAPIGYVAIARNDICTNQGFKSVVPRDGIGTCFVYEFLKLNKQLIEDRASGSTFKEISTAGMRDIPIMIPDVECLKRFETSAWPLFLTQENKESESRALAAMRDALLPKLMSGELAVEKVKDKICK